MSKIITFNSSFLSLPNAKFVWGVKLDRVATAEQSKDKHILVSNL